MAMMDMGRIVLGGRRTMASPTTRDSADNRQRAPAQTTRKAQSMKNFNLYAILEAMLKISDRVSDLNFSVGRPPQVEVDGQLVPVNFPGLPRLTPYQTEMIAMHMLRNDRELTRTLLSNGSVDLSYSIPMKTRLRVTVVAQDDGGGGALREAGHAGARRDRARV